MNLRALIRQPVCPDAAHATATVATLRADEPSAPVATVAVADAETRWLDQLPSAWAKGLVLIASVPPPRGLSPERWRGMTAEATGLARNWGPAAHALGWTTIDLFGCSPGFARRLDRDGVAMLLDGRPVVALDAATATIANRTGPPNIFRRREVTGAVALWKAVED